MKKFTILFILFTFFNTLKATDSTIISLGSVWKYLDNGSNQGTAWTTSSFNDASWASGPAQLGYGDGDEATVVSYGSNSLFKHITTYFRKSFTLANPGNFAGYNLRVLRDDGVVVFINGVEVARDNLGTGTITSSSNANSDISGTDETTFLNFPISSSAFQAGNNVISVEIHQFVGLSSDISMDIELIGTTSFTPLVRGPYLQIGTPNSVNVRWRTSVNENSKVIFGTNPNNLNLVATNSSTTTEHELTLSNLTPNTKYYYRIGNSISYYTPQDTNFHFITSPPHGTVQPVRIWAIGDAGMANNDQRSVRDAYYNVAGNKHTDIWLMLGDNAYEGGSDTEYQGGVFENMYEDALRNTILWPCPGNHDYNNNIPFSTIYYHDIFSLPKNGEAGGLASGTENYYSYNYANIHFVSLDSYSESRSSTGTMATWLKNDLAANTQKWTIVYFHHPPYTKGSHDSDNALLYDFELPEIRQNIVPILEDYGVDLVLNGHSHCYERSYLLDGHYGNSSTITSVNILNNTSGGFPAICPYVKKDLPHQGTVYSVVGCSGKLDTGSMDHPAHFYSTNTQLGSMIIDVVDNQLSAQFINNTGAVLDSFTILKKDNNTFIHNIIIGNSVDLTASWSGGNYSWSTGSNSQTITVNPTTNTTYLVTSTLTCLTDTHIVEVNGVGIDQSFSSLGISIYPNPVQNKIIFENNSSAHTNLNFDILDIQGRIVQSFNWEANKAKNLEINVDLPNGEYILYNKEYKVQKKILVKK